MLFVRLAAASAKKAAWDKPRRLLAFLSQQIEITR
jgi:hypothetical protein